MGNWRAGILTMVLALTMSACSSPQDATEAELERLFAPYAVPGMPGAALRVLRDGEPVLTRTWGLADVDAGTPIGPATNFRLASVTKQFTATAIMLLVEDGKLTLESTLTELFPEFPSYGSGITVRYLLQHRSGLLDYEPMVPEGSPQVHDDDVLRLMLGTNETYFEPGSEYRYSNTGYALLAMAVEKLSGLSFAEFLSERIFEPAGMSSTVAYREGLSTVPNRAYGYRVTNGDITFSDQSRWSAVWGDGGVYSSLDDLTRWYRATDRGAVLSTDSIALMLTPALENYGFGWWIDEYRGHRRHHHYGETSGFRNVVLRFPDQRLTIIVLTNRADPDVYPVAERVADLFLQD